ncbi:hypothetical protein KSW81_008062 [Nannochloris sp. 'desiccata']|nr:hypothetical protein KSW81_008062 [Chlorella desiccata (nom. nud.)]
MAGGISIGLWPLFVSALNSLKNGNLPPKVILIALVSEALGLGIVLGSTMVKMPQILAVVRAKSAEGLSPLSFELETLGLAIAATYGTLNNLAFSAYGESAGRSSSRTAGLFAVLAGWGGVLASGAMQPSHLNALYDFNNILLLASRVPQILQSYSDKSTGQLSIVTYALNLAGAAARIFTTLQQKNAGTAMLRGAMLSTLLNAVMVGQIIMYRGNGTKGKKKAKRA